MNKKANRPIDDEGEDSSLFRTFTQSVKPLASDNTLYLRPPAKQKKKLIRENRQTEEQLFFFSDGYQSWHQTETRPNYHRPDVCSGELKKLKQGFYLPEVEIDLHGYTQQQAKIALARLLTLCQKQQLYCASIIHGHGKNILKKSIPNWLAQHPKILAFTHAPKRLGGDAALLILIELPD